MVLILSTFDLNVHEVKTKNILDIRGLWVLPWVSWVKLKVIDLRAFEFEIVDIFFIKMFYDLKLKM